MPKYDRYHPDYGRLYPEIQARPDVLSVLKKSDRKMEYMEVDIKQERFSYDPEGKVADLLPSREDPYDRLIEEEHHQFALDEPTPENVLLHEEELHMLDLKQQILADRIAERPEVSVVWFRPDEKKDGGQYVTTVGQLKKVDDIERVLRLADDTTIPLNDVLELQSDCFRGIFQDR